MLNKVQLIGRLGGDPQIFETKDNSKIAKFSLATSEKWKDKKTGEKKENAEWHSVIAFGNLANIVDEYLKKGNLVYVEGKIKHTKHTDNDGIERHYTDIQINNLVMLSNKNDTSNNDNQHKTPTGGGKENNTYKPKVNYNNNNNYNDYEDDDIPF